MVAISLYRGNLHRVPDVPRQWLMPTPKISLKDFKLLLNRRSRALSRLHSTATTSNPNPNPSLKQEEGTTAEATQNPRLDSVDCCTKPVDGSEKGVTKEEGVPKEEEGPVERKLDDQKEFVGGDCSAKPVDGLQPSTDAKAGETESSPNLLEPQLNSVDEKTTAALPNPNSEVNNPGDASNDKVKRKKEVEEKLQILQARKHNLVQVLKQILNAEEELKRRSSSTHGTVVHPTVASLQVEVANDSVSVTRHQMGGGDIEGAENENVLNHNNTHPSHLLRMSSTSPSSDSPHRRAAFSAAPYGPRATLGVGSSPSRFAPTAGQQSTMAATISASVSGTNYIISSPSPAASGGTSVFRDARLPSPWN